MHGDDCCCQLQNNLKLTTKQHLFSKQHNSVRLVTSVAISVRYMDTVTHPRYTTQDTTDGAPRMDKVRLKDITYMKMPQTISLTMSHYLVDVRCQPDGKAAGRPSG
eukprot:2123776-Amphidinium_carterae.1